LNAHDEIRRFTIEEHDRMREEGILPSRLRTELRDGQIYQPADNENYRFTTDEYFRIVELGIFPAGIRTELLDGQIYEMAPSSIRHEGTVTHLDDYFRSFYEKVAGIRIEKSLIISHNDAPKPDIALIRPRADSYTRSRPEVSDVFLLAEVADPLLPSVLEIKAKQYAKAGIRELWVVDLQGDRLVSYRAPIDSEYEDEREHTSGRIAALAFHDIDLKIDDLLGRSITKTIRRSESNRHSESSRRSDPKAPRKR
jgi:Uma2 family endonuclease